MLLVYGYSLSPYRERENEGTANLRQYIERKPFSIKVPRFTLSLSLSLSFECVQ